MSCLFFARCRPVISSGYNKGICIGGAAVQDNTLLNKSLAQITNRSVCFTSIKKRGKIKRQPGADVNQLEKEEPSEG